MFCSNCGEYFEACSMCNPKIFYWKQMFCSISCFKDYETNGGKIMRVQYDSKTYTVKDSDVKNGLFILNTSDGELEVKEDDLQVVILPIEEFKKVKYGRFTKPKAKIEEAEEE